MPGIVVDIGTGNGKFVSKLAIRYPDRLIIGIDPNHHNLIHTSLKNPKNSLYLLSDIENLPKELNGIVNQIFINFPWGSLLRGIINVENQTWNNLKRICRSGAFIDIILGFNKLSEKNETIRLVLPELSEEYLSGQFSHQLSQQGFKVIDIREIDSRSLKNYPTSWAKKLAFGKPRKFYYLRIVSL